MRGILSNGVVFLQEEEEEETKKKRKKTSLFFFDQKKINFASNFASFCSFSVFWSLVCSFFFVSFFFLWQNQQTH
jgi:hypothetical protein